MGLSVALLLLVVYVSLTEAAGCIPTTSLLCYKNSTQPFEDFNCTWDKRNPKENQTHTLHIWDNEYKIFIMHKNCGKETMRHIPLEELITSRKVDIWVQTQMGSLTCNSSKISVILECMVKYSEPQIISMNRSAGILSLKLDKTKDKKGVKYEIRWREAGGSQWKSATFETEDSPIQDSYELHLQKQTAYQIKLRRQVKLQPDRCEGSEHTLWSDWSPVVDVPLEIQVPPVHWVEITRLNGTRLIKLTWDKPPAEESVGGVKYNLNVTAGPCDIPPQKKKISKRIYEISITYSEASISFIATNKVGSSPQKKIIIPAVKHRRNCDMPSNITTANQTCLEWYKLENGENRTAHEVKSSFNKKLFKDIEKEVEKFVRHYYYLHTLNKKHLQTVDMCPFYSEQGVPKIGPRNVTISNETHDSAVVSWVSIPVEEQRGFLLHYLIWISGQGNTTFHEVQAHETIFNIRNLQPGTSYTVSVAGKTIAGKGPNSTENFETLSKEMGLSPQDQTILSVCAVALLSTVICSVSVRRFKSKLIPEVPSPVIDTAEIRCQEQDPRQIKEEVHEFVLLLRQDLSKPSENVTPEQRTLLQGFGLVVYEEEGEEDEEGEVTDLNSVKSCCYPNPSYRGQTLHLPEPFHMTDSTLKDNDIESTYRNGLFFDTTILESDKTTPMVFSGLVRDEF